MNITKITTALQKKQTLTPKKIDKMVTILDRSIPGDSYVQILAHKNEIAAFAKEHGLSNVTIYDPRRKLGEIYSGSVEQRMMREVDIQAIDKNGLSIDKTIDFFEAPRNEFIPRLLNKVAEMSEFFTKEMKPTIKIDETILANMSKFKAKYLTSKALKTAEKMKITNIEITPTSTNKNSPLRLKLERVYDKNHYSTQSMCIDGGKVSTRTLLKKIKGFDGPEGMNKISDR